jgi:hypothetical protein
MEYGFSCWKEQWNLGSVAGRSNGIWVQLLEGAMEYGFSCWKEQNIFSRKISGMALGLMLKVPRIISLELKQPRREADH